MANCDTLLCEHDSRVVSKSRVSCDVCGSFLDLAIAEAHFEYDESYPHIRHHHDAQVGRLKISSLERWLKYCSVDLSDLVVCEVGFGGGYCLHHLTLRAKRAFGIEVSDTNINHAKKLGVSEGSLLNFHRLPDELGEKVDLWLFLDSFEHLENPPSFLGWALKNSSSKTQVLIVAPNAESLSQKLMGRAWIHRTPDHRFHWSKRGLFEFFKKRGFTPVQEFSPLKSLSLRMALSHFSLNGRRPRRLVGWMNRIPDLQFVFNIGELGLRFQRSVG